MTFKTSAVAVCCSRASVSSRVLACTLSRLGELAPGVRKLFGQLLDPAFRGRIIVGGAVMTTRPCPYTRACTW